MILALFLLLWILLRSTEFGELSDFYLAIIWSLSLRGKELGSCLEM
ncbi:hypothetical protein AHF37_00729 [Paragonimus kellicotti]|nr:hypothetical protein AHF37_00729 [Paragonimus kellicotti]